MTVPWQAPSSSNPGGSRGSLTFAPASARRAAARSIMAEDHGMMTIDLQAAFLSPGRGRLTGEGRVGRGPPLLVGVRTAIRDLELLDGAKGRVGQQDLALDDPSGRIDQA